MSAGSFGAALSGLDANSQDLTVIGNNLANINTVGFKASSVNFEDLVSQQVGGSSVNPLQSGLGVAIGDISSNFSQGSIENTSTVTNIALQGSGFFVVNGPTGQLYTRAGDFTLDAQGNLVDPKGQFVQGYTQIDPTSGKIITTGATGNIRIPPSLLHAPVPTSQFQTNTNLDARASVGTKFSTALQIFDSLGNGHQTTMTYTKTSGGWSYAMTVDGGDVTGGTAGTPSTLATGTLTFGPTGALTQVNGAAAANVNITTPTWTDGGAASTLSWQILDSNGSPTTLTGYASASATSSITQNGSSAGSVTSVSIAPDGSVNATYGTGQAVTLAVVAVANFNDPEGLVKVGSNDFSQSEASGLPNIGVAQTGGRGTLVGSALEQSNVDIATEFTRLILAERGYQANSKSITVSDQLLSDTINLKQTP